MNLTINSINHQCTRKIAFGELEETGGYVITEPKIEKYGLAQAMTSCQLEEEKFTKNTSQEIVKKIHSNNIFTKIKNIIKSI